MLTSSVSLLAAFLVNAVGVRGSPVLVNGHSVDVNKFRLRTNADYITSLQVPPRSGASPTGFQAADYVKVATNFVRATAPNATFRLVGDHYIGVNGIGHVYFKQTVHGLDIDNADFNVNVAKNGSIFSYGTSFFSGAVPSPESIAKPNSVDPIKALASVNGVLGLSISSDSARAESQGPDKYIIKGTRGANQDPNVQLVYFQTPENDLVLTWRVETDVYSNWLLSYAKAGNNAEILGVVDYTADAVYNVYPWGVNDPSEGNRVLLSDPWNTTDSEYTWQGDGSAVYNTTRGNNAIAQVNWDSSSNYMLNYRPQSSDSKFDYTLPLSSNDFKSYADASVTQLFYTVNMYHDLLYELGFTEAAGNFQASNGKKGGVAGDFVVLNAQDGAGKNNANFATPPEGQKPRMRMYMWDKTSPGRDGVFEADIVVHENTHGLSNRLTGGPANTGCLGTTLAGGLGEGWSDFFATAVRIKTSDTRNSNFAMGAWVTNNVAGIRKYPYSTSTKTNAHMYVDINSLNEVHDIGTVWATMLYELLWNLIDAHGLTSAIRPTFNADHVPTDGRYLAMQLVMNGMALQPCSPNFVQARDAILDADVALTKGANACSIWKAFAKRGLGSEAKAGRRVTQSFDLPNNVC